MVGRDCDIAPDVTIDVAMTGRLLIGDRTSIRRGTTIEVSRGATVIIGNDVAIGEHVFLSSMVGIYVGHGAGISNMVDIHDHNHRNRSFDNLPDPEEWTTYASGFDGAPIVIESGAVVSNKCTVLAGSRVGFNTLVAANAVVSRSLPPNSVAVGSPATVVRSFAGPSPGGEPRARLSLAFFGTSLMEHLEGFSQTLFEQWNLPAIGTTVAVEGYRNRGYPYLLETILQADYPHVDLAVTNVSSGGATSRDVLATVETSRSLDERRDLGFVGCGVNDVWRRFQDRMDEAVDPVEYRSNYAKILDGMQRVARQTVVVGEPPTGLPEADELNRELRIYNEIARGLADERGMLFVDVWPAFVLLSACGTASPWSDGVHLSDVGDALVLRRILEEIAEAGTIASLLQLELFDRNSAVEKYAPMMEKFAPAGAP